MFVGNNIECREPSRDTRGVAFSNAFALLSPANQELLRNHGAGMAIHVANLYSSILRASLHSVLNSRECGPSRHARARIFIFHFNLHFSRSTHVREKGRTPRTLVRNSYGASAARRCGRREFTSAAGGPLDSSCSQRNYLVVITTGRRLMTPGVQ